MKEAREHLARGPSGQGAGGRRQEAGGRRQEAHQKVGGEKEQGAGGGA